VLKTVKAKNARVTQRWIWHTWGDHQAYHGPPAFVGFCHPNLLWHLYDPKCYELEFLEASTVMFFVLLLIGSMQLFTPELVADKINMVCCKEKSTYCFPCLSSNPLVRGLVKILLY